MAEVIQSNLNWYKYCFIPNCKNTSVSTPEKEFIAVPRDEQKRKLWCDAAGCPNKKIKLASYCCEDHFDLKEDLENYEDYIKLQCKKKKLKPNFLPRFLVPITAVEVNHDSQELRYAVPTLMQSDVKCNKYTQTAYETEHKYVQVKVDTRVKNIQVNIRKDQSVGAKNNNTCISVGVQTSNNLGIRKFMEKLSIGTVHNESVESVSSSIFDSSISDNPSTEQPSSSTGTSIKKRILQSKIYDYFTKSIIEDNPLLFIGICKESMYVIDLLHKLSSISIRDIYLVLKKIRSNNPYSILGYEFSLSESQACRVFEKNVFLIAKYLKQLIVWPDKKDIYLNLPLQFRFRYKDVQSIIDCFEIEIEKPSNALHQSLTWSDYKKCNTVKYLISVTPDGLVNYISEGAAGRCTDMILVEKSGFLDVLPCNVSVLADRGFKHLDTLLQKKNCKLIRPPSVQQNIKSSKSEVKLTKQIASIRIHVERVINRIRNFKFLDIHSRIDNELLNCIDSAVFIAAGLVNLQTEIIKQS